MLKSLRKVGFSGGLAVPGVSACFFCKLRTTSLSFLLVVPRLLGLGLPLPVCPAPPPADPEAASVGLEPLSSMQEVPASEPHDSSLSDPTAAWPRSPPFLSGDLFPIMKSFSIFS